MDYTELHNLITSTEDGGVIRGLTFADSQAMHQIAWDEWKCASTEPDEDAPGTWMATISEN